MAMLRSRLESRVNFILTKDGKTEGYQELSRVLELARNSELILHEMTEKIESARYLEEFVAIMDSAALSVSEVKGDLEQMVPAAEAALEEMHDTFSKVSTGHSMEVRKEIDQAILAEVTATIAAGKASDSKEQEKWSLTAKSTKMRQGEKTDNDEEQGLIGEVCG
jgi:hypothetical protein